MTKEEILRTFLADEIFIEKKYLKEDQAENYKWATPNLNKLIEVLKIAIDDELSNESSNITEKKINKYLNQ